MYVVQVEQSIYMMNEHHNLQFSSEFHLNFVTLWFAFCSWNFFRILSKATLVHWVQSEAKVSKVFLVPLKDRVSSYQTIPLTGKRNWCSLENVDGMKMVVSGVGFFYIIILTTIHGKYISIFYSSIALIVDSMTILERAMKPIFDLSSRIMAVGFASD